MISRCKTATYISIELNGKIRKIIRGWFPMFRGMRRFKQQVSEEECIRVLKEQPRGVLSMIGDDGYPYGIPLDHWYCEENGKLYFHCAKTGYKLDAVRKHDKVSYCVMDEGYRKGGEWALNINSVVVFGRIRIVEGVDKKREIDRKSVV